MTSRTTPRGGWTLLIGVLALAPGALLGGCATFPAAEELRDTVAVYPGGALPAVHDGRARFRQIFCELVEPASDQVVKRTSCDDLLWRLQDEASTDDRPALPGLAADLRVFVVSGAFSDCREPATVPFEDGIARLASRGISIEPVKVSGRSGPEHNARQLAEAVRAARISAGERIVMIGYSKGAVDVLQFLSDDPELARQVVAVVSVAGAIQGSPLAGEVDWWYRTFFDESFAGTCDPGDGLVLQSLLPATRRAWLETHALPAHVAYFSLAAFTTEEHLSNGLRATWKLLAGHDRRNDGQLVIGDAVIPGSTLLGYVNADHWDLAIALERQMPYLSARKSSRQLPRTELLEAMLLHVSEVVGADADRRAVSTAVAP
ncbi:MAG TPA: hypothetical protein VFP48_02000 [Steroidobacteraceae bacterium]|nr:hypothetical protein [Steroidobacteraceae bacterium]